MVSVALFGCAAIGLVLYAVQLISVRRHLRALTPDAPDASAWPPISILKPLCGADDELDENLRRFAQLDYPDYEVVLGVRSVLDGAYPAARRAARRWPGRVRVVIQRGEPGANPKVNQLVTLARAARHDVLVVSDSNVRTGADYLRGIAAHLADPRVGLVTHPVVGVGEARLGSLLDNLHLAGSVGAGMIGAKRVAHQDIVVGKSMALRRADLDALGGFESVAHVLAEDYVMGKAVAARLGKRVVVAERPVQNVSTRKSVREFFARYRRWAVIHRQAVGPLVYGAQILLNPLALAVAAWVARPSVAAAACAGGVGVLKASYDAAALKLMRGGRVPLRALYASALKDALLALAWLDGTWRRDVVWRSNRLRVLPGTVLEVQAPTSAAKSSDDAAPAAIALSRSS
jgi:ceramide glucosyltransferase